MRIMLAIDSSAITCKFNGTGPNNKIFMVNLVEPFQFMNRLVSGLQTITIMGQITELRNSILY